jgi:hypothetical protein
MKEGAMLTRQTIRRNLVAAADLLHQSAAQAQRMRDAQLTSPLTTDATRLGEMATRQRPRRDDRARIAGGMGCADA